MTHGESGVHGGWIQPYCLLPKGLYHAPAGISVELHDVDLTEGKAFNTIALLGYLAAPVSTAVVGPRSSVLADQTDEDSSSGGL